MKNIKKINNKTEKNGGDRYDNQLNYFRIETEDTTGNLSIWKLIFKVLIFKIFCHHIKAASEQDGEKKKKKARKYEAKWIW